MHKKRDLMILLAIYAGAYLLGALAAQPHRSLLMQAAVFDFTATVVTFVFSLVFTNSSVYDAYWSLTPMVMALWIFAVRKAFGLWQLLFLAAFLLWSVRLTGNWIGVFTDFSYEDWRYRKFRAENGPVMWFIINFFGIHLVPTIVVFLGMLPLFAIADGAAGPLSIFGVAVMLLGTALEFFADREMHAHLSSGGVKGTCREGLWKFSRHPNYLGEISVWLGTFLAMLPYAPAKWYLVIGFAAVTVLFLAVSIPLAEKRQLSRRPDYAEYRRTTSCLIPLPPKKG